MKSSSAVRLVEDSKEKDLARMSTALGIKLRILSEALSPLLQEGSITFAKNSLTIRSANLIIAADISFDGRESSPAGVEDYVFNGDKPITVGVSFESMQSCLSSVGPSDIVSLRLLEKGLHCSKPYMILTIAHPAISYIYTFKLPLLCLENLTRNIPKISFQKVVSIPSNLFLKILRTCAKRGDSVQIFSDKVDDDYFLCFNPHNEMKSTGSFKVKFTSKEGDSGNPICLKKELYSLKFLLLISKCANLSNSIQIYLKENSVLGIGISVGVIGTSFFALAPNRDKSTCARMVVPRLTILSDEKFLSRLHKTRKKKTSNKRRKL